MKTQSGSILHHNRRLLHLANTDQVVIRSEDVSAVAKSHDPVVEPFYDFPKSTKAPQTVVSSPTRSRDVGLTSGFPCASQDHGTYRTSSGCPVIRPARFTE